MSTFKKIAMRAAASAVTAAAVYGANKLVSKLLSSPKVAAAVPSAEEIAERARMGRMSRKARKQYRAGKRAAEAFAH